MEISDPKDSVTLRFRDIQNDIDSLMAAAELFGILMLVERLSIINAEITSAVDLVKKNWKS